jgi:WhiB family redox-sensing transcriptional regulator
VTAAREPRLTPTGYVPYGLIVGGLPCPEWWHADALCAETDPDAWFPEKGGTTKDAKAICEQCLVRVECLTYALDHHPQHGVWGGASERERRKILGLAEEDTDDAEAEAA